MGVTGERPVRVPHAERHRPEVVRKAAGLIGPVLTSVKEADLGEAAEAEAAVQLDRWTDRARRRPQWHVLVVGLVRRGALQRERRRVLELRAAIVDLVDEVGVVVLDLVIIRHDEERMCRQRGLQLWVSAVLRVTVAVVRQRPQLVEAERLRCRVQPIGEHADRVVLVDEVADVQHEVEILGRHRAVPRPVTVLEVLTVRDGERHRTHPTICFGQQTRVPDRTELALGPELVPVVALVVEIVDDHMHRVRKLGPCRRAATSHDATHLRIAGNAPLHHHRQR